jgi:hypothetical protein
MKITDGRLPEVSSPLDEAVSYVEDIWFSKIMEENQFRFRKDNPFCA